ncbi:hypothetical protein [Cryobacterium psychrophilum]|uniref:Uncharacterized protein n=1 Tax=Cryobacterium psychrophilum TaxID=41988 RepID=A0A4Y8KQ75_9MICO|nr:hypothetical protein [Cryobacterium psychrophilum]TFD81060.1 hypothetical protein E3T53_03510 [Cryobacterium psychrophilum]
MSAVRGPARISRLLTLRRIFVVLMAIGAVLVGLLSFHSMMVSQNGSPARSAAVSNAQTHVDSVTVVGAVAVASSALVAAAVPVPQCDQSSVTGCVGVALACLVFAVVAAMTLLLWSPLLLHRFLDRGRRLIRQVVEVRNHVYLPSLTVLSISRT